MRARLALAVSGQAYELREVVLRNKPAALLAASAKATVPVLVLPDGKVIDQSLDIMLWALRLNDPANWLNPPAATLGEMLALVAGNDTDFKHQLDRYKYPNRRECNARLAVRRKCTTCRHGRAAFCAPVCSHRCAVVCRARLAAAAGLAHEF